MNLVPAIKEIERKQKELQIEYIEKDKEYKEVLNTLRKLNTVCENCNGQKKILRSRSCAEDDRPDPNDPRDFRNCKVCGGSGKAARFFPEGE